MLRRQIEKNLDEGALGVSHSLEYQPAPYAEMLEYAKLAKKYERPMFLHLRYSSSERELEGVEEAIRLARDSGARIHIDHLHSTGGTFHMEQALEKIRTANAQGLTITTCVYPYSFWATYLSNNRFGPGWQQRYGLSYEDLRIVGSSERLTARSFAHYRKTLARSPLFLKERCLSIRRLTSRSKKTSACSVLMAVFSLSRAPTLIPAALVASPPRFDTDWRSVCRLEKILEKITSLPRSVVAPALKDRGVLEDGAMADLTVFDPATIRGNATIENPNQFSSGIDLVIVNGKIAFKDGMLSGEKRPGDQG